MAFRSLLITQQAKLSFKSQLLVIQTQTEVQQIPISDLQVVVIGTTRVVITSYLVMALLKQNVALVFTDDQSLPIGEIQSYYGNKNRNRNLHKQIQWASNDKEYVWQQIVIAKMTQQIQTLTKYQIPSDELVAVMHDTTVGDTNNREAVVARMYFPRLFGKNFVRSDSSDLINIKLDYGYAIILAAASRELSGQGYLTQLGVHHHSELNNYNFASDCMEIFRPFIDQIVYERLENNFDSQEKAALINVLNREVTFNGRQVLISTALATIIRDVIAYLNHDCQALCWDIKG